MKGVLLSGGRGRSLFKRQDVTYFLHRYGISTILGFSFLFGLIFGALCAGGADKSLIENLKLIFASDFTSRCSRNIASGFAAAMTSNFIFFTVNLLLGFSVWGGIGVPFVIGFKGFGIGITGGYLYKCHGLAGIGFFLLIMLLGNTVSSLALIQQGKGSVAFSGELLARVRGLPSNSGETVYKYAVRNSFILIALAISSMVDAILNTLFADIFVFS